MWSNVAYLSLKPLGMCVCIYDIYMIYICMIYIYIYQTCTSRVTHMRRVHNRTDLEGKLVVEVEEEARQDDVDDDGVGVEALG